MTKGEIWKIFFDAYAAQFAPGVVDNVNDATSNGNLAGALACYEAGQVKGLKDALKIAGKYIDQWEGGGHEIWVDIADRIKVLDKTGDNVLRVDTVQAVSNVIGATTNIPGYGQRQHCVTCDAYGQTRAFESYCDRADCPAKEAA